MNKIIKISTLAFTFSIAINVFTLAQDQPQTIFQRDTTFHKGRFFSPAVRVHFYGNDLNTEASTLVGGTFGWVFNRSFLLGVGGFGKVTRTRYSASYAQRNDDGQVINDRHPMGLGYGYGGLVLGFVANSNRPVHFTFPVLIGLGTSNEYEIEEDGDHGTTINSPGFFIIEPAINMEVNLLEDLRFNLGLTYRYMDTSRFDELDSGSLNGLGIHVAIKFGSL